MFGKRNGIGVYFDAFSAMPLLQILNNIKKNIDLQIKWVYNLNIVTNGGIAQLGERLLRM